MEVALLLHPTRRTGDNFWKLCGLTTLEPKGGWAELIGPGAKSLALFGQRTWIVGQLELRQQSFSSFRAASPSVPRQGL